MAASGLEWMNGYTLQAYLYEHYLLLGLPQALWLAENYWLCVALSVAIIFFEFTFIVGVFVPSVSLIFVLGGLGLHAGILYFMDINFFSYHALAFLVFLRWDYVGAFSARVFRRSSSPVRNETL